MTPKHVSGTIKADARAALEELANLPLGIPLEDWGRLSSRILAAIQPDPETQRVIEDADMKRCAGCGSVRDRRGMDCLEDGSWRCCDCIKAKPKPVAEAEAYNLGYEDCLYQRGRRETAPATPSSAGTVSVEAAAKVISAYDRDYPMRTADQHRDGCDCLRCSVDALRALAGERG